MILHILGLTKEKIGASQETYMVVQTVRYGFDNSFLFKILIVVWVAT